MNSPPRPDFNVRALESADPCILALLRRLTKVLSLGTSRRAR